MFRLKSLACQEASNGEEHSAWGQMAYLAAVMQSHTAYGHFSSRFGVEGLIKVTFAFKEI